MADGIKKLDNGFYEVRIVINRKDLKVNTLRRSDENGNHLKTLKDDDYYIFMIINKRNDINMWIYDLKTNIEQKTNI